MEGNCLFIVFKMITKRKRNKATLETQYEALKEFGKIDRAKKLSSTSTFLEVHFLLETN